MGKHGENEDNNEAALQAMADRFDADQAAIDARAQENQTNYPAIQSYENKNK